jgi:hypothetical protein
MPRPENERYLQHPLAPAHPVGPEKAAAIRKRRKELSPEGPDSPAAAPIKARLVDRFLKG